MRLVVLAAPALTVAGCVAARVEITPTRAPVVGPNFVVVEKSRDEVWAKGIPALAGKMFAIDRADPRSGLVAVTYSGDPERYVQGPTITASVQSPLPRPNTSTGAALGPETSAAAPRSREAFPGTRAVFSYQLSAGEWGQWLITVTRQMSVEAWGNIVIEQIGPARTRVTATVKYSLTEKRTYAPERPYLVSPSVETITFNTGGKDAFASEGGAFYFPSGVLEAELLSAFQ